MKKTIKNLALALWITAQLAGPLWMFAHARGGYVSAVHVLPYAVALFGGLFATISLDKILRDNA